MVRGRGGHREGEPSPLFVAVLYYLPSYRTLTKSERREGSLSEPSSSSSQGQPVWQQVCQSVSLSVSHRVTDTIAQNRQREPRGRGEGERGRYRQCSAGSEIHASLVRRGRGEANRHTDRVTYRGGSDGFNTLPPEKFNEKYQLGII